MNHEDIIDVREILPCVLSAFPLTVIQVKQMLFVTVAIGVFPGSCALMSIDRSGNGDGRVLVVGEELVNRDGGVLRVSGGGGDFGSFAGSNRNVSRVITIWACKI